MQETFGLTALESQACGTPVVGIRGSYMDRIIFGSQEHWARENSARRAGGCDCGGRRWRAARDRSGGSGDGARALRLAGGFCAVVSAFIARCDPIITKVKCAPGLRHCIGEVTGTLQTYETEPGYTIRSFRASDRAAVRRLCCQTGFLGAPIDPVYEDHELFADFLTTYYTDHEPESSFVLEVDGELKGYLLGSRKPFLNQLYSFQQNIVPFRALALALSALQRAIAPLHSLDDR